MLRPYRINNLKIGIIDPAKLNSTLLWNPSMTWWLGLLLSLRPQSLACMQTFKTHTNHFLGIPIICAIDFPPFHLVNINASCFPLLFGTYGWASVILPRHGSQVTVFPLTWLLCVCRQGWLQEQLHHWRRQVSGPEHGDCGGGLHVQVSHHKMCLHYTWASQFWEPGESTAFNSSVAKILGLSFTFGEKANLC